jgi:hypothetical protein
MQMARAEKLRGLRAIPVGFSGILALLAALIQGALVLDPVASFSHYLTIWLGVAILSSVTASLEMAARCRVSGSGLTRSTVLLAVEQFAPCVVAGALVTFAISSFAPESIWILPGIWQVLFSLGLFATHRLLPRPIFWVAVFYMVCGILLLSVLRNEALSSWAMGLPFGVGQLAMAGVLYWTLERLP